jgi:hypothetical protein
MISSEKPKANASVVVPPVAQPGHAHGTMVMTTNSQPQCFHSRVNPVTAVSPVASVYRSISMLRKYCVPTPMMTSQTSVMPTWDAM